jgi:hypothetical protein
MHIAYEMENHGKNVSKVMKYNTPAEYKAFKERIGTKAYEPIEDGSGSQWSYKEYDSFWYESYSSVREAVVISLTAVASAAVYRINPSASTILAGVAGYTAYTASNNARWTTYKYWRSWSSYYDRYVIDCYTYVYEDKYREHLVDVNIGYDLEEKWNELYDAAEIGN